MVGAHTSLNVATALGIALYDYRRVWPGGERREQAAGVDVEMGVETEDGTDVVLDKAGVLERLYTSEWAGEAFGEGGSC